ncbi:MAG: nicotinamide riboside transporter PnuC, partial [Bacteroidia bacterium]
KRSSGNLFYSTKLYSEAILYVYYVLIGIYGYWVWTKAEQEASKLPISNIKWLSIGGILALGSVLSWGLGWILDNYTDAESAYLDAHTTVFSFIASYLEARKILSAWLFWIVINGVTIYLYLTKGLDIYSGLTLVYFVASFVGFYVWRRQYLSPAVN